MFKCIPICCSYYIDKECSDAVDFKGKLKWFSAIFEVGEEKFWGRWVRPGSAYTRGGSPKGILWAWGWMGQNCQAST